MWRRAEGRDDERIVELARALYEEDPGSAPVPSTHTRRTLTELRAQPARGRALVLDLGNGPPMGYALLISYWSNELGGEICVIDEVYVAGARRGGGHCSALVESLAAGGELWPGPPVALGLEVSPKNTRARSLYERLAFSPLRNTSMRRMIR